MQEKASPSAATAVPPQMTSENDAFSWFTKISAALHLIIGFIFVAAPLLFPHKPIQYVPSVRVDLVGLPDMTKAEQQNKPVPAVSNAELKRLEKKLDAMKDAPKLEPVPEVEKEVAKPDEMVLKKETKKEVAPVKKDDSAQRKKQLNSAIERMKALEAIRGEQSDSEAVKPLKGNVVNKGSALFGEQTNDTNAYVDSLVTKIRANWDLPIWMARQKASAKIVLRIRSDGSIGQIQFVQTSGNEKFDQFVRNCITKSAPFDPPPADIESDGIMLGFPL